MLGEITLTAIAGDGGKGTVSFRREKYVPRGGPDGGDGGRGGDVLIRAETSLQVLEGLRRRRIVRAEGGRSGGPAKRHGRNGKAEVLLVPVGSVVWKTNGEDELLADLDEPGMQVAIAHGGDGGKGNARFATSTRQVPRIAERGLAGEQTKIKIELRLVADVGLVGLPNAGKSSLLRAMSSARPKVGAYPFTTLEPELGVVESKYEVFVVADIPGLIERAHEGKGLGIGFLQHVERTRVLVHVVDLSREEPLADLGIVRNELEAFGHGLVDKQWVVALNKIDMPGAGEAAGAAKRSLTNKGLRPFPISAATGAGVDGLITAMADIVREERQRAAAETPQEPAVVRPRPVRPVEVARGDGMFVVRGDGPARVLALLGWETDEARGEALRRLRRMGVARALHKAGARAGDKVRIANVELEWPG
ncbi:MAG: GTPase ObgE [Dehalococcoidia bacterium]